MKRAIQKTVTLLVTESELNPGVYFSQYTMYDLRVLESMELKVELPMLMEIEIAELCICKIIGVLVEGHVILKHYSSTFAS